jgi:hypothetical protein
MTWFPDELKKQLKVTLSDRGWFPEEWGFCKPNLSHKTPSLERPTSLNHLDESDKKLGISFPVLIKP